MDCDVCCFAVSLIMGQAWYYKSHLLKTVELDLNPDHTAYHLCQLNTKPQ